MYVIRTIETDPGILCISFLDEFPEDVYLETIDKIISYNTQAKFIVLYIHYNHFFSLASIKQLKKWRRSRKIDLRIVTERVYRDFIPTEHSRAFDRDRYKATVAKNLSGIFHETHQGIINYIMRERPHARSDFEKSIREILQIHRDAGHFEYQ